MEYIAESETPIFPELVQVIKEYHSAKIKHGDYTLDGDMGTLNPIARNLLRLAALGEEFGEVAELFTYDKTDTTKLRKELIQVANVALTWASILR